MFFIVDACFFVMWFGAWSSSHGLGSVGMAFLWTAIMGLCLLTETRGSWRRLSTALSKGHPAPIIIAAGVTWLLYFTGFGDWLNYLMPKTFPSEGALFLPAKCGLVQCAMAIIWTIARLPLVKVIRSLYDILKSAGSKKKRTSKENPAS